MKFTGSSALLAGAALLSTMSAVSADGLVQAHAHPLIVKPGGIVTVTMNFVVDNYNNGRRLAEEQDPIQIGASVIPSYDFEFTSFPVVEASKNHNDTKNHTSKHAGDDEVTLKSARVWPNTWKPKQQANITDGKTGIFELPEDGLVLDKEYKITYKFRVGRAVPSGPLEIPIDFAGPNMALDQDFVEVLVK